MATRKQHEFLDIYQSEEDDSQGYDSEVEGLRKGGRSPKRRKVEKDASDDEEVEDDFSQDDVQGKAKDVGTKSEGDNLQDEQKARAPRLPGVSRPLTKKNLVATAAAIKKSGVVYLSRIPPFMKPSKLRSLLEPYGAINRIYLTPEDDASRARRKRSGGNTRRLFTEGWIEYVNKADAKHVCELLNARIIGGKKGSYYHDDVWNLLYLKGFKWRNLTEQIAAENAERASRMRAEISKTIKENKEFVQNVERAKMLDGMEVKRAAKKKREEERSNMNGEEILVKEQKRDAKRPLHFTQTPVAKKERPQDQVEQVKRVLSKIF